MNHKNITPNSKLLIKMLLTFSLIAVLILASGALISFFITFDSPRTAAIIMGIIAASDFVFWVIAMLFSFPYYRSLKYEILDDEVIVKAGILTHSVKHVPYRTVTNISVKRDILDRWLFNLGSLEIQTAGISGKTAPEEKLEGLDNVGEVYELVAAKLRHYRGAMTPTVAEIEPERSKLPVSVGEELLEEVRNIRRLIEEKS